ncbi:MAG: Crp/Fnr family transcriptional regulator [Archangium sp.]|nr:Crp/Fnr family transcriptional regulator [Archangium sp.]
MVDPASLYERFSALGAMSRRTFADFLALGEEKRIAKHAFWSQPGEKVRHFALVLEGLVRHYYVDPKGRESVKAFRGPGEFSAPYAEIIQRKPSRTFIQALADTTLLTFDVDVFEEMASRSLEVQRLARRFVELHFVGKEQREYEFLQLSAEERYQKFCAERPEHLNQIPQHQVASYIGITPVALSRIRARVVKKQKMR